MSVRTSLASGRIATGESDVFQYSAGPRQPTKGIVFAHGSGQLAGDALATCMNLVRETHRFAVCSIGDLGGQTWGGDLVVTRIGQAITMLQSRGVIGPIALVGGSMGGCSVLNYAYQHPEDVACVAAVMPLVDMDNAYANPWLVSRRSEMEAIYGDPPDFTGHNPVEFASSMDSDLPIHIWSASDDLLTPPETHAEFVANRPQTGFSNMGPLGHSQELFDASVLELVPFIHNALGGGWA